MLRQGRANRRHRSRGCRRAVLGRNRSKSISLPSAWRRAGAKILRGGAFKPRSSPYTFQGMGEKGLKMMRERGRPKRFAGGQRGDGPVAESADAAYVDILQVGARNMQNYHLLRALGEVRKPVLLKRGMSATIEELLLSAEYIMAGGNYNVILCERGIRTFETSTRNTLDIAAIPVIKKLSHLPIVADPSHGTGRRDKVAPMARAAVAAGADGLAARSAQRSRARAFRRRAIALPRSVRETDGASCASSRRPSAGRMA